MNYGNITTDEYGVTIRITEEGEGPLDYIVDDMIDGRNMFERKFNTLYNMAQCIAYRKNYYVTPQFL